MPSLNVARHWHITCAIGTTVYVLNGMKDQMSIATDNNHCSIEKLINATGLPSSIEPWLVINIELESYFA